MCSSISFSRPAGMPPSRMYARLASVVIVNPLGTGIPSCVISARPTPLPPRRSLPPSDGSSKSCMYRLMGGDSQSRRIVGRGGFPGPAVWEHVLQLAGGRRVLADRTASPQHLDPVELPGELTDLSFYPWPPEKLRELALSSDVVLVCGGNTANMLAVWRVHGFDRILREAWEAGVVLFGWSAGMICWFEAGVTDSFRPGLDGMRDGLGFLAGSACPHYDGEALRGPRYRELVDGGFPGGVAADDGVGVHYVGAELLDVVTCRPGAAAYRVTRGGEEALPARLLDSPREHRRRPRD